MSFDVDQVARFAASRREPPPDDVRASGGSRRPRSQPRPALPKIAVDRDPSLDSHKSRLSRHPRAS
eukprot:scaffold70702_cov24-Tisochrysis_lutea.AAC.2